MPILFYIEKKNRPREHQKSTQLHILNSYKKYDRQFSPKKVLFTKKKNIVKNIWFYKKACVYALSMNIFSDQLNCH